MKRYIILFITGILLAGILLGCKEEMNLSAGEGSVQLRVKVSDDVSVVTRAVDESIINSMQTRIYNEKGLIRYFDYDSPIPTSLQLVSGDYHAFVIAGDSVSATFDTPYYIGHKDFSVRNGETAQVQITCSIANVLTTVEFAPELSEVVSNCQVKIFTPYGELLFTEENLDQVGYFMLHGEDRNLGWSFEATKENGQSYTQAGIVEDVNPATKYAFTFNYNPENIQTGGAFIDIKVNETAVETNHEVMIAQRPQIVGDKFDITQPLYFETNGGNETGVWVNAATELTDVIISCDQFTQLGLSTTSINFMTASQALIDEFTNKGIEFKHIYQADRDLSNAKITFTESFIRSLANGDYIINIHAFDALEKDNTQALNFSISDAIVVTAEVARADIWFNRATIAGTLLRETSEALSFQYREVGTEEWTMVPATLSGTAMTAEITGLSAGTTYEYQAVAGTSASVKKMTFTTEDIYVLPNSSFENWQTLSSSAMVVYGANEAPFWDTGNHGSATMRKNVTTPDETYKHSGNYSVKLGSQFVGLGSIGKFAAGNIFAGTYVGTDGTNGILDFGQPFNSRPAKLRGYIKYIPGTVDYSSTDLLPKGSTDIGQIYIAIGDWDTPVRITTKDQTLFSKDDEKIIAYGELNLTEEVQGSDGGLTQIEIELDYRSMDRIPTYIVIVASASRYGDFFSGSTGSTMWIDDLELVYE